MDVAPKDYGSCLASMTHFHVASPGSSHVASAHGSHVASAVHSHRASPGISRVASTCGSHMASVARSHVASPGISCVASICGSHMASVAHSHVAPPGISWVAYMCGSQMASVTHLHVTLPGISHVGSTDDLHVASVAHLRVASPASTHAASDKGSLHIGHVMAQQSTPLLAGCRGIDWGGQHHHTHMQLITSLYDQSLPDQGGRFMYHHTHMQRMALTHDTHAALRLHDPGLAVILFLSMAALPLGSVNASCSTHNQLAQSLGGCCGTDLGGAGLSVVSSCIHAL